MAAQLPAHPQNGTQPITGRPIHRRQAVVIDKDGDRHRVTCHVFPTQRSGGRRIVVTDDEGRRVIDTDDAYDTANAVNKADHMMGDLGLTDAGAEATR
jgi:hypothetical protein